MQPPTSRRGCHAPERSVVAIALRVHGSGYNCSSFDFIMPSDEYCVPKPHH